MLRWHCVQQRVWSSLNSHSWTTECMGPTPPRMPGSWFFLMSVSHSVTAYWITLSTPRRLEGVAEEKLRNWKLQTSSLNKSEATEHWTDLGLSLMTEMYLKQPKRFRCWCEVCISTRVCSRASSASTQSSLTGPDRSESLQTFPVKQRAGQSVKIQSIISWSNTQKSFRRLYYKHLVKLSCHRWAVWPLTCSMTTCLPW